MKAALLLVSPDAELARRVRRALPVTASWEVELTVAGGWPDAVSDAARSWLLALVDIRALAPGSAPPPWPRRGEVTVPVVWLGELPLLAASLPEADALPGPIVDFLDRNLPASKLAFVLQQHLAATYLRSLHRGLPSPPPEQMHAAINNVLTGILGNAELAAELARSPNRRLPPPLAQRLDCIVELASRMRFLLENANWPEPARS